MHRKIIPELLDETTAARRVIGADARLSDVAETLVREALPAIAVTAPDNRLIGHIAVAAVIQAFLDHAPHESRAQDIMASPHDVLAPTDSADDAFQLMRARAVSHLPIADADGRALGMLFLADLTPALAGALDGAAAAREAAVFGD